MGMLADTSSKAEQPGDTAPGSARGAAIVRNAVYILVLVLCVVLLYFILVRDLRNFLVPSGSMRPTLLPTDYIYTLSQPAYKAGDIVVLKDPNPQSDTSYVVKRIVATGGETVKIMWGALYIDGSYVSEPYTMEPMAYDFPPGDSGSPFTVPEGEVFVLGDNRNASDDSSTWGPDLGLSYSVPASSIVGRVQGVYLPWNRIRVPRSYPLRSINDFAREPGAGQPPPPAG